MRISNIQNFAANTVNYTNKTFNSQKVQNNLERSPMQDVVSFGRFDSHYSGFKKPNICTDISRITSRNDYEILRDSIYFTITPTSETKRRPELKTYEIVLINDDNHGRFDKDVDKMLDEFTIDSGLEKYWYKNLRTKEDFSKLASLHLLWYVKDKVAMKELEEAYRWKAEHDNENDNDITVLNMYDKGLSF